eukprot:28315_1
MNPSQQLVENWKKITSGKSAKELQTQSHKECQHPEQFESCGCISRIITILRYYDDLKGDIMRYLDKYSIQQLIDDYLHIKDNHFDKDDRAALKLINYFAKHIGKSCDINHCSSERRNNRNRGFKYESKDASETNLSINDNNFEATNWIDLVHVFFMHSNVFGRIDAFRQIYNESKTDDEKHITENDIDDSVDQKLNIKINASMKNISTNSKFVTNMSDTKQNEQTTSNKKPGSYGFGQELYYWRNTNHTWCKGKIVDAKYKTLKEEVLKNAIYTLDIIVFNILFKKTTKIFKTKRVKTMKAFSRSGWNPILGINAGVAINFDQILATILYTDCSQLCYNMRKSFRKNSDTDSLEDVMKKNSEYAHFSRCLFEITCLFGSPVQVKSNFYHGINCLLLFDEFDVRFYAPVSTSISPAVAMNFSTDKGMVLKLGCSTPDVYFALDVSWMSQYPHELERLLFNVRFTIRDMIIEAHSYAGTMKSLHLFQTLMNGSFLTYSLSKEKIQLRLKSFIDHIILKDKLSNLSYFEQLIICYIQTHPKLWLSDHYVYQNKDKINQKLLSLIIQKNENNFVNFIRSQYKSEFKSPIYFSWTIKEANKQNLDNKQPAMSELIQRQIAERTMRMQVVLDREFSSDNISCNLLGAIDGVDIIESSMELYVPEINYHWKSSPMQSQNHVLMGVSFFPYEEVLSKKSFTWNVCIKILKGFDKSGKIIPLS